ncbi:hypothetical protein J4Q44_G00371880 [Coregonus suidteri]|uniref:Uncharacterized protein n=1 Tax=Coregonus suidteri TaxID=861788 RepID=A0AAN8KN37_9TELE
MAAVAVLRNETLQAFLQDRTPNSSPENCKHSPLALLAATCNRIGHHHGSSPADFLQQVPPCNSPKMPEMQVSKLSVLHLKR